MKQGARIRVESWFLPEAGLQVEPPALQDQVMRQADSERPDDDYAPAALSDAEAGESICTEAQFEYIAPETRTNKGSECHSTN